MIRKKRLYWRLRTKGRPYRTLGRKYVKEDSSSALSSRIVTITVTNPSLCAAGVNDSGFYSDPSSTLANLKSCVFKRL